jgi:cation diffusion facilitator family transporter
MSEQSRGAVVYAAIAANLAIATVKFIVAAVSGSSAMLSEAIHSSVDTANELVLLVGLRRSQVPPDDQHPYGHGKTLYFSSLIVAVGLFGIGGGMSIYEGVSRVLEPRPLTGAKWSYLVLAASLVFEGISWIISFRALRASGRGRGLWTEIRRSKDPSIFTVVVEDSSAIAGLAVAALGVFLAHRLRLPWIDGAAAIAVGTILASAALLLGRESGALLVGESASREVVAGIRELVGAEPAIESADRPLTMQLGPEEILLNLRVRFRPGLDGAEMTSTLDRLERAIRARHPSVKSIFIDPRTAGHQRPAAAPG